MSDRVLYDLAEGVATITLNRPESMNSLDVATKEALRDAVRHAEIDATVRAVILTARGRAFSVGQDLKEHKASLDAGASLGDTVRDHYNPITLSLATMAKPVVAAVNGIAAGAGAGFAFACDFRIAAASAGFNLAFSGVALSADSGTSWTLPRLVGHAKAIELLMFPDTIRAEEAKALGLVNRVVPDEELADAARSLATLLASGPTLAFGAIKRSVAFGSAHALAETLGIEDELQTMCGGTADHREAVNAFLAKRKPEFQGR